MKLAVFIDSVNVENVKKVSGFVGMVGSDCDCKKTTKQKDVSKKMQDMKKLCAEKYSEKKKNIPQKEPLSNKPSWDEAPEGANILVYSPFNGWIFGSFTDARPMTTDIGWVGAGSGSWFKHKYRRIDESVKDWTKTLEFRPITVDQAMEKIEKIIDDSPVSMLTKEEDEFFEKIKAFLSRRNEKIINPSIIKDKTSRVKFGNMENKYKLIASIEKAGLIKKVQKGWLLNE